MSFPRLLIFCCISAVLFASGSGNSSWAQTGSLPASAYPPSFSDDEAKFLTELTAFMNRAQLNNVTITVTEFTELWNSRLSVEQKKAGMQLFNAMLKKKLKPSPHFERVMDLLILAGKRPLEPPAMLKLIQTNHKTIVNLPPDQAFSCIGNLFLYFKYSLLHNDGFYKLKVSKPGKISFDWAGPDASIEADTSSGGAVANKAFDDWNQEEPAPAGSSAETPEQASAQNQEVQVDLPAIAGPVMQFEQVTLKFETGYDSASIRKTNGTFLLATGVWVGDKGVVDWQTAGLKRSEVYADLKQYSFRVKYAALQADNVMLFYKNRLESTVLGAFEWKTSKKVQNGEPVYPRFKSYYNESSFRDVKDDGILYRGGFSMEGRQVNSSSVFGGPGVLKLKNKDRWAVSLVSRRFDFLDTAITSASAAVVIYYGNDSIVHPSVRVVYNTLKREIRLYKNKGKLKDCPFFDSGHNMEYQVDLLTWDMDKPFMDLSIVNGKTKVPALFESVDFFHQQRFSDAQGIFSFHPLMMVQAYAKKAASEEFLADDMAQDYKQNPNAIRAAMTEIASSGFIEYNPANGNIKTTPKLYHYTNSQRKKKDFDQVSVPSVNPPKQNAKLLIDSSSIIVYGVDRFFLSDSLKVFIEPRNRTIKISGNRDIEFDGQLNAGNFQTFGEKLKFNYADFKVEMGKVDSILITTPAAKKGGKPSLSRLYGQDKNAKEGDKAFGRGTLYINEPDNRSAMRSIPKYPIFDINTPSFIYFDKPEYLKGKYGPEVFFKLPPFQVDSTSGKHAKTIGFEGQFTSDSIFPTFPEKLKIQPDKSLGFVHQTPAEGYPLFGSEARFFGIISLDYRGLRGKGEIKFMNTTLSSEDFIFYTDSITGRGRSASMVGTEIAGVAFPQCEINGFSMKFNPKKKVLSMINAKGLPFQLYEKTISLEGQITLAASGLTGRGYIQTEGARAESSRYRFEKDGFHARGSFFEIKSANPIKPAVACKNVRVYYSFKDRRADFSPEVKGSASNVFPFCQYKTSIPQATWWIDRKEVTMEKPDSVDLKSSFFYSTRPDDSLFFNASGARYDISEHRLSIKGVPFVHVADVEIKPDSGRMTITEGANVKTLENTTVLVDRINKFHVLKQANIKILSRDKFEGDGIYQYVNALKDTLYIKFDEFTLKDPNEDKKALEKTSMPFTVSGGEISETKPIKLAKGILYKGQAFMSALKPNLEFKGQISLDLKRNKNAGWINYESTGESREFVLNVADAKDDEGQPLISGLLIEAETNRLYNGFLAGKHNPEDLEVFKASGILNYVEKTQEFRIGTQDRFDDKTYEGGILVYNDSLSNISVNGPLYFQPMPDKEFQVKAAGFGVGSLDTSLVELTTSVAFDFNMPSNAWRNMGSILAARVSDLGLAEATEDKTALAYRIANIAGDRYGKDYERENQTKKVPVFNVVPKLAKSIFLSEVKLAWHAKQKAWYSIGKIGVSHIQGTQVNGIMDGMLEIRYTDAYPVISLHLEPSADGWYFFTYDDTRRMALLSAQDDFNLAVESKSKQGKEGEYFFALAETFEKKRFIKNFRKNYLGIDDGGVEEPEPTRDKEADGESGETSEDEEQPKKKKKKKSGDEESSGDEEPAASDKDENQNADEGGFGEEEKPKKKKKASDEGDAGGDEQESGEGDQESEKPKKKKKAEDDDGFGGDEPAADDEGSGSDDEEKPKKKKKKKAEDGEETSSEEKQDKDTEDEGFGGSSKPAETESEAPKTPSSDASAPADSSKSPDGGDKKEKSGDSKEGAGADPATPPAEGDKKKEEDDGF